tara:strand:+ start:1162 stop:1536 length:375 start_codon:yes stop_codon:yes gene_type:complete
MKTIKKKKVHERDNFIKSYFGQVKATTFQRFLTQNYYGEAPFEKKHSYAVFKKDMDSKHYMGKSNFADLHFTYKLLYMCAKQFDIIPTAADKVAALKLFDSVHEKANSKICKCCKGLGYKVQTT